MPRPVTPPHGAFAVLAAVLLVGALATVPGCGPAGASSIARGKQIYLRGESPSGDPLTVSLPLFGDTARAVPASRYACVNCHGPEGQPKLEGGVAVPDIRPHRLAAELRASGNQRRTRRPYDAQALGRAIRMGRDASGNALNPLMPHFDISDRDLADLRAYLAQLGREAVPGVTRDEVVFAAVVPDGDVGGAVLATLRAFVADTNASGGIYDRRLRLAAVPPAEFAARAADPRATGDWLCAVAPIDLPVDLAPQLPLIGAIADDPLVDPPLRADVFWLHSAQATQLRVAIDHWTATLQHPDAHFTLLLPGDTATEVAAGIAATITSQAAHAEGARVARADAGVFLAGAPGPATVALVAGTAAWKGELLPRLLARSDVAAVYATHRLPPATTQQLDVASLGKLRLLTPVPLPDEGDPALAAFRQFLARHDLAATHVGARVAALVAAATFAEGLKRCGANVTRDRLRGEIGALHSFRPGLFPPLSYDLNHRVGAAGAQVLGIDAATRSPVPQSAWTTPR